MRLEQARAELAHAGADWSTAISRATSAMKQSQAVARGKYEAAALAVRAQALEARGRTREAMLDANAAWEKALEVGDPALQVRVLAPRLHIIGEDRLLHQLRVAVGKILAALPPDSREAFERAAVLATSLFQLLISALAKFHKVRAVQEAFRKAREPRAVDHCQQTLASGSRPRNALAAKSLQGAGAQSPLRFTFSAQLLVLYGSAAAGEGLTLSAIQTSTQERCLRGRH